MSSGSVARAEAVALALAAVALTGCGRSGLRAPRDRAVDPPPPAIASHAIDCDVDAGTWTLTAEATGWTGGGRAVLSRDLVYVEEHTIRATESAPDGSRETLELVLTIVSDWRNQAAGSSTVFTCAQDPTVALVVLTVDEQVADCRVEGPLAEELAALPDVGCTAADTGR